MAKTEVVPKALDLPDVFGTAEAYSIEPTRATVPYVLFAQPKATEQWTDLATKIPGLQEGDQVLVHPEPKAPEKISPMRFTMMACRQYWVQKDPAGARIGVSAEPKPRHERWGEEVLAACIVYVPKGGELNAVPASCVFKTVKCPAALSVKLQIEAASEPSWAETSPAHRMAYGALAKPFLRVVGTVHVGKRTSGKGFTYLPARATVSPATPSEWKAVKDLLVNGGLDQIGELSKHFKTRLSEAGL